MKSSKDPQCAYLKFPSIVFFSYESGQFRDSLFFCIYSQIRLFSFLLCVLYSIIFICRPSDFTESTCLILGQEVWSVRAGGMDRPSHTKSHPAGSLSSSQPGGQPCWASPLAFGLIGYSFGAGKPHQSMYLCLMSLFIML